MIDLGRVSEETKTSENGIVQEFPPLPKPLYPV